MKTTEELKRYRQMNGRDLVKELSILEKKIFAEISRPVTKEKVKQSLPLIKKNIARVKTIINEQKSSSTK